MARFLLKATARFLECSNNYEAFLTTHSFSIVAKPDQMTTQGKR